MFLCTVFLVQSVHLTYCQVRSKICPVDVIVAAVVTLMSWEHFNMTVDLLILIFRMLMRSVTVISLIWSGYGSSTCYLLLTQADLDFDAHRENIAEVIFRFKQHKRNNY